MDESDVQSVLASVLIGRDHELVVPNVYLFGRKWESDLVSVTKSGYVIEYEIKCSRADFERDTEKRRDWFLRQRNDGVDVGTAPNRFFYVLAPQVDTEDLEVPEYAGHITAPDGDRTPRRRLRSGIRRTNISEAPRLHSDKISDRNKEYLARGLMHRYWQEQWDE